MTVVRPAGERARRAAVRREQRRAVKQALEAPGIVPDRWEAAFVRAPDGSVTYTYTEWFPPDLAFVARRTVPLVERIFGDGLGVTHFVDLRRERGGGAAVRVREILPKEKAHLPLVGQIGEMVTQLRAYLSRREIDRFLTSTAALVFKASRERVVHASEAARSVAAARRADPRRFERILREAEEKFR